MLSSLDLELDELEVSFLRECFDSSMRAWRRRERNRYIGDAVVILLSFLSVGFLLFR